MTPPPQEPSATDVHAAVAEQRRLRARLRNGSAPVSPRVVAGVDIAYDKHSDLAVAAAVAIELASLEVVATATCPGEVTFGYLPGLLGFREAPLSAQALAALDVAPDLVVCDGHGRAHSRGFGLACHLGVIADLPTVGMAKNAPEFDVGEPGKQRGSSTVIKNGNEVVGACLRTQDSVRPIYVSAGNGVALDEAVTLALRLTPRYRLPATTRLSDRLARDELAWRLG